MIWMILKTTYLDFMCALGYNQSKKPPSYKNIIKLQRQLLKYWEILGLSCYLALPTYSL